MKILHITAINTLMARSGIPAVLKGLCEYQNNIDGFEARVLSLRAEVKEAGSPFFDNLCKSSFKEYLTNYNPDIVIIHDFYYYQYAIIAFWLKRLHIPFVLEPHGAFGQQAMKKSRLKKWIANNTLFRILIDGAEAFIFTNEGERNDAEYKKNKVFVVPNGVEAKVVDCQKWKCFAVGEDPIFYFLGRYDINHKGLDYLFDALDILDSKKERIIVNMYGIGSEEELSYVHKRIAKIKNLKVEDKGTIYDDEKVIALRKANILVLTSRYEGSPMTILDALSYGNPCLVTPGTNVAEDIVAHKIGWKAELNAEAIADCMLKAKEEYKMNYSAYYERCKNYVLDNFLWNKIAQQSIEVYKEIIG